MNPYIYKIITMSQNGLEKIQDNPEKYKRKINEDSVFGKRYKNGDDYSFLAILADGVGGLEEGALASEVVCTFLSTWFDDAWESLKEKSTNELLSIFDKQIKKASSNLGNAARLANKQMGSTMLLLFLHNRKYLIASVGDSRAYLAEKGKLKLITHDQTLGQQRIDRGEITEEELKGKREQHILLQCMGMREIRPDYFTGDLEEEEYGFLLCSDGLHKYIHPTMLENIIANKPEVRSITKLRKLTDCAALRGSKDDISSILIERKNRETAPEYENIRKRTYTQILDEKEGSDEP